LFAVGGHRGATVGSLGEVDDPEPDLGVHRAVSRPAHLGSQQFSGPADGGIPRPRALFFPPTFFSHIRHEPSFHPWGV
jgi:hypothetical protein